MCVSSFLIARIHRSHQTIALANIARRLEFREPHNCYGFIDELSRRHMCTRTGKKIELFCTYRPEYIFGCDRLCGISYCMLDDWLLDGWCCWWRDGGGWWYRLLLAAIAVWRSPSRAERRPEWILMPRLLHVDSIDLLPGRDGDGAAPSDRWMTVGQGICQRTDSMESCSSRVGRAVPKLDTESRRTAVR
ncbi:AAEL002396-PA, partial [Aedes aegypti]